MTHELGHSLGLEHTFDGGCGSQLDDVIPCPGYDGGCYPYISDINKPDCNNNIMSYATVRRYLSPKQIGLMHRTLTRTSSARFVRPNSNSPTSDIYIAQDETWDTDRFATGDIYVETGSTLTVSCVLFMPPKARIIVKRGARLIVECGQITTNRHPFNSLQKYADGDYWGGIEVWGNTEVEHDVTMRSPLYELQETDPGIVLLDNAEISNAKPGIATVQRGGYNVNHNSAFCSELPGFTICDSIPCYVELKQDYLVADSLYNKDPSDEYNRDRIIKMSSRFESLRKVIKRLQTEKDYTSFLTLINDEDHDLGRKAKLWYYIDQELWEDARDYLDLLDIRNASDQAFIDAQEINLNRLEYGLDYTLSASEIERLWEIAHTILPDRSFARGLLVYMLDTIFEPQFPHDSIINRQSNLEEITQEITSQPDFLLLPNPYTDHLIVAVNGIDLQICDVTMYVSTLQGQIIHEQQLDSPQTNIFLDNHLSGIFIVSFVDCNNKKWVKKLVKI